MSLTAHGPGRALGVALLAALTVPACAPPRAPTRPTAAGRPSDPLSLLLERARRGRLARPALRRLAGALWARARELEHLRAPAAAWDAARLARRLDREAGQATVRDPSLVARLERAAKARPRPSAWPGQRARCPRPTPTSKAASPGLRAALVAAARGQLSRALGALAARPKSAAILRWRARLLLLEGRRREALRCLSGLRRLSAGHMRYLPALLSDLVALGFLPEAEELARALLDQGLRDPVLLRPVTRALVAAGRPGAVRIAVDRWAHASPDPARVYAFTMAAWAALGVGRETARWAKTLLSWLGARNLEALCRVIRSLRRAGRSAEARRVARWAQGLRPQPRDRQRLQRALQPPSWPRTRLPDLHTLNQRARRGPAAARAAVGYLAASRAQSRGQPTQTAALLVDALLQDPARYGREAWLRLAAAARGHRLSPWIPWAMLGASAHWSCPR